MKTIFITTFHPLISRNILLPLLAKLERENLTVVLVVPQNKLGYFKPVFEKGKVLVEGISTKLSLPERFLRYYSLAALSTRTLEIKRRTEMRGSGKLLSFLISHWSLSHELLRLLSDVFASRKEIRFFEKYQPTLVFSTDIQNEIDLRFLQLAKKLGIKTLGMIRSWDNPTSKGLLRFVPDKLVVNNDIIRQELKRWHRIPEEKTVIVGIPHYDFYFKAPSVSREKFFEKISGDAGKKLLLLAPTGDRYLPQNRLDRAILDILDKNLSPEVQILVRLPPTDTARGLEKQGREGRIIYDRPENPFKVPKKTEFSLKAEEHLQSSLYCLDLLVAGPSTMAIDAAFFGKPVVLVGFDGYEQRPYYESIRRYYDYNHWEPVLKSGGVKLAENIEDFKRFIREYLENPKLDEAGRKRLVQEQVYFQDGKSSERLANLILSMI